ncbi:MAG TPA: site-specific integrase [Alphaproteobacteria bacterium]|nr:site-specific integrase [Alphaproteobacteria bacterium]
MALIEERTSPTGEKSYRVRIRLRGFPPATATFERKTDAKEWATRTEAALKEGRYFKTIESRKHTLNQLIDKYLRDVLPHRHSDHEKIKTHLAWWKGQLGYFLLADITPARLVEERDRLAREPSARGDAKAAATVVRYMASLSHVFTLAVKDWGWMDDNPMLKVRKPMLPRGRIRFLNADERKVLLEKCRASENPYLYTVVILALSTGARYSEIMELRWPQVDLAKGTVTLTKTKNKEWRVLHLHGHALELLHALRKVPRIDTPFVFPRADGKAPQEIRKHWEKALKVSKIEDFRFHDLRHTAASYLLEDGATLVQLSEILGHKTLQMVKRYAHLSEQQASDIVKKMNERVFGG